MVKFVTNASGVIWWPNLQPMQVAPYDDQIWNLCKWRHLVDNFATKASFATWWPNLEPKKVAFYSAGEITQVIDSIPWVRCASGNVFYYFYFFSFREKRLRVTEATAWVRFASGNVFLDIKNHFWCFGYISNCPGQFCDLLKYSESTTKQF